MHLFHLPAQSTKISASATGWMAEPFLHIEPNHIYNPLTDQAIRPGENGYEELCIVLKGSRAISDLAVAVKELLIEQGWIVADNDSLANRFLLKYVSLEAHTVCNQACYFCPVSINPREDYFMPTEFYEDIVRQLSVYRNTIEAVFMINYNEPTLDKRFVDQVRILKEHGLPPGVNTNGSGLTPARTDALMEMGGLRYLSVNLSTMDRSRYERERGKDHLRGVMRNLDYVKDRKLAVQMDLIVLGVGDDNHRHDFEEIAAYFSGSNFEVKYFQVMDRAGYLPVGLKPARRQKRLCGCENVGSRPLQHLHITPHGRCVLCCEDYDEKYVVGDLTKQTVEEILTGPEMARMRRWVYGLEEAPDDFMCRDCVFARAR